MMFDSFIIESDHYSIRAFSVFCVAGPVVAILGGRIYVRNSCQPHCYCPRGRRIAPLVLEQSNPR